MMHKRIMNTMMPNNPKANVINPPAPVDDMLPMMRRRIINRTGKNILNPYHR